MQICFIIDNSFSMTQKCCNNMRLIDYSKSAIETCLRNISRTNLLTPSDSIHLYKTSNPSYPLSTYQHDELHLLHQLKNIQGQFPTYTAQTLKYALSSLGRFRVLTTAQNVQGYRQGDIIQPTMFMLFTDRMTKRRIKQLQKLYNQNYYQLRSQYQIAIFRICPPSLSEKNVNTFDVFKKQVENQQETLMLNSFVDKINATIKLAYNYQQLLQSLQNTIENFKFSLYIQIANKSLNVYQNLFSYCEIGNQIMKQQPDTVLKIQMIPMRKKSRIPLPINITLKQINQIQIEIDSINIPYYYVDFSKTFNSNLSSNPPYQKFRICRCEGNLDKDIVTQFNHPLFWVDQKGTQFLMGFLKVGGNEGMEIHWFFANFPTLDSILKNIQQKISFRLIQPSINSYLSSIPQYYFKFVQQYLQIAYNIKISHNQLIPNKLSALQSKIQQIKSLERKNLAALHLKNCEQHRNNKSKCCSIYSDSYQLISKTNAPNNNASIVSNVFNSMVGQFLKMNAKLIPNSYLQLGKDPIPITRQLEKYNFKKIGEEFNENIAIDLGNPFKRKKEQLKVAATDTIQPIAYVQGQQSVKTIEELQPIRRKKSHRKQSMTMIQEEATLDIIEDLKQIKVGKTKKITFNPKNYNQAQYRENKQLMNRIENRK